MKEVTAIIKDGNSQWEERHPVPDGVDALQYITNVVQNFCGPRGYNYEVVGLKRTRRSDVKQVHNWEKKSLVTERGGYDIMHCTKCGVTGKRYGLSSEILVDKRYITKYSRYCKPK